MFKNTIKSIAFLSLTTTFLNASTFVLYNNYLNMSFMNAKNSMMANSTTATAKGYSAMLSNPAGLSTNYNASIYIRSIFVSKKDSDSTELPEINPKDHISLGALYDSFGVEAKENDYIIGAGAYGLETKYGLFSLGISYLADLTDLTLKEDTPVQSEEFATGSHLTYGFMWQKSFIDADDFYAVYLGLSHKNSGKYEGENTANITPVSPSRTSYGLGLETNIFDTSLLVTVDMSEEYWQSLNETLSGVSYGVKWMINQKFAIAAGMNNQTFTGSTLKDIQNIGLGVEFGFLGFQTNTAFTQRVVNDFTSVYLTEMALHLDVAFTF